MVQKYGVEKTSVTAKEALAAEGHWRRGHGQGCTALLLLEHCMQKQHIIIIKYNKC